MYYLIYIVSPLYIIPFIYFLVYVTISFVYYDLSFLSKNIFMCIIFIRLIFATLIVSIFILISVCNLYALCTVFSFISVYYLFILFYQYVFSISYIFLFMTYFSLKAY